MQQKNPMQPISRVDDSYKFEYKYGIRKVYRSFSFHPLEEYVVNVDNRARFYSLMDCPDLSLRLFWSVK